MLTSLKQFRDQFTANKKVLSHLVSLYGVQIAAFVLPLLTLPYLARVLGLEKWGQLAAVQALFLFLSFIVEYGFSFSATRDVASNRQDRAKITAIFSGVLGAKILLSSVLVIIACLIFFLSASYRTDLALYVWSLVYAIVLGFSPFWYYQGIENLRLAAWADMIARILSTLFVFIVVHGPIDAWKVPFLTATCLLIAYTYLFVIAFKNIDAVRLSLSETIAALRSGSSMFFFRFVGGLYTTANAALLRFFAPGAEVAFYSGADKILSGAKSSILPINQLAFPRISALVASDIEIARKAFRQILFIMLGISCLISFIIWWGAPLIVSLVLGGTYAKAVEVLRVMILAFPVIATSNAFGMQWMLPNRMDRQFNIVIFFTSIVSLLLVITIARHLASLGVAYVFLISELLVTSGFIFFTLTSQSNPFKREDSGGGK